MRHQQRGWTQMTGQLRLDDHLQRYSETAPHALAVAAAVDAIAAAAIEIADLIATGDLADASGLTTGRNSDGDVQRDLDVQADAILRRCLGKLPIAALASEEMREPQIGDRAAKICVAIDPLDGSSNIDINMTVGTIFSILPAPDDLALAFHQRGSAQLAAGFVTYGPQTSLVLTLGDGVDIFTLDRRSGCFRLARSAVQISETLRGVRDQRLEPPALGTAGARLRRRMPRRCGRAGQPQFQHALDRLAGCRGLSHPHPRRRVPLSLRCTARLWRRPPAPRLRSASDGS